ncbi:MAG: carbamoyltransferase HypF [Solirubrobacteraceae bacterium MAG38_C4-C5]|nr:carbamoyltransferase HypF [Candidatus Siliceabacter maunaloa]
MAVRVEGIVQGVGFRPFVFRLAHELGLAGWVRNDEHGVLAEVEGPADAVEAFVARLGADAPPLAEVDRVVCRERAVREETGFAIVASGVADPAGVPSAPITADSTTCADCLAELFDPADRRYRYPFVNCTNCGPRFTIVRGVPYDRALTTMAAFTMCDACQVEYDDPLDRRFHAQPNACPVCGPAVALVDGGELAASDPVRAAADALLAGRIVAVKGLGGYHLACRADDEGAVTALRARKHREDRPFALMAPDVVAARALVELDAAEEALLTGRERPIVLARRRPDAAVARSVAPGAPDLGVMLPYTPLHHLLAADTATTLVMTSANLSDEPIAFRDDDASRRLAAIADAFLVHDRPIETRTDDSVVRVVGGRPLMMRRSRGFVPASLALPVPAARPLLACGAELKSTFCVARGERAWVGHHIGDLKNFETLASFREGIAHFEELFAVVPEVVAHDLHPNYLSTAYAVEREGVELVGVQHHHAHLAACLAEHGEGGPAVGAILDGSGYGTDGTVWGGELLVGDLAGFERAGHLWPVRLPGGDRAVREPWRMACTWLIAAGEDVTAPPAALAGVVDPARWRTVAQMVATGTAAPMTTSAGRLFDAVGALCGLRAEVTHEGQAAIELEAAALGGGAGEPYRVDVGEGEVPSALGHPPAPDDAPAPDYAPVLIDPREAIRHIVRDVAAGVAVPAIAARFHAGLAEAVARACARVAARRGLETVVLSGGVFQNRVLLEAVAAHLGDAGLRALVPKRLPPNDGGIAYGQAAVVARRME